LQGLKDRLAVSDDPEADVLRQEVERLEQEIEGRTNRILAGEFVRDVGRKRLRWMIAETR
jgi:hypothetical protein